jgi:uncharacterized protein YbaP (TraB family)
MEPWLAAFTLSQEGYSQVGLRSDLSLPHYLEELARTDRKVLSGIESPKEQICSLADTSRAEQEKFLVDTIKSYPHLASETQAMRAAWLTGDVAAMQNALGLTATPERSGVHQSLIGNRNHTWVARIKDLAGRNTNSMVVVGVEHLIATPYALPDLLTDAGLEVHRVSTTQSLNTAKAQSRPAVVSKPFLVR